MQGLKLRIHITKKQNTELHADRYYVLNAADTVDEIDVYKLNRLGLHVRVKGN